MCVNARHCVPMSLWHLGHTCVALRSWLCERLCVCVCVCMPCVLGRVCYCRWVSLGAWYVRKGVRVTGTVLTSHASGAKCDGVSLEDSGQRPSCAHGLCPCETRDT